MATRKKYTSGSDFIRAQSSELTTAAVIEQAAKVGLTLTPNLVRIVRYKMRKASGDTAPRKRGRKPGPKPAATNRGRKRGFTQPTAPAQLKPARFIGSLLPHPELASTAREADTFCRIVTKIGTTKARALLDELEK